MKVLKRSDITKNGNVVLTLSAKGTVKKTALGNQKTKGSAYLAYVEAESCDLEAGDTVEINLNDFDMKSMPFEGKDNQIIDIPVLFPR